MVYKLYVYVIATNYSETILAHTVLFVSILVEASISVSSHANVPAIICPVKENH
jgi:hypothetical protein